MALERFDALALASEKIGIGPDCGRKYVAHGTIFAPHGRGLARAAEPAEDETGGQREGGADGQRKAESREFPGRHANSLRLQGGSDQAACLASIAQIWFHA